MKQTENRLFYIDHIRVFLIIMVVIAHSFITYSGVGGWYYIEKDYDQISTVQLVIYGAFIGFTAAYSMGLMFFIAGYFLPRSYDKRGFLKFTGNRFVRLGLPALFYIFIINPLNFYVIMHRNVTFETVFQNYKFYIIRYKFLYDSGPLWFAVVLLILSLIYAFIRLILFFEIKFTFLKRLNPNIVIIILILLVSYLTYLVRLDYPIGTEIYNYQVCFYTQYVFLFVAGIICFRLDLLNKITYRFGLNWLKYGLSSGLLLFGLMSYFGGAINDPFILFGGKNWQSFIYALWESITGASMIIGLITIFKTKWNKETKFSRFLSKHAFGVYVLHTPVLIYIALQFKQYDISPVLKTIIVASIAVPASFIVSYLIKKIKFFNMILS